jgi:hypothetical protein
MATGNLEGADLTQAAKAYVEAWNARTDLGNQTDVSESDRVLAEARVQYAHAVLITRDTEAKK